MLSFLVMIMSVPPTLLLIDATMTVPQLALNRYSTIASGLVGIPLVKYPILDSRRTLATPIVSALVAGYDRHTSNIVVSPQKILNIAQYRDTL